MQSAKGIITGHFIAHWRVPSAIHALPARGIAEFAVLEFPPKPLRSSWRYATNGMSSYLQPTPDRRSEVRCELFACTNDEAPWVIGLLAAAAAYPLDYNTYLAEGDTIDVGQPIDRANSSYTGLLLIRPGCVDPPTLGLLALGPSDVLVHQVVGLLPAEVEFASRNGAELLSKRLSEAGGFSLDRPRSPVV